MQLVMPFDGWFFDRGPVEIRTALETSLQGAQSSEVSLGYPLPWQQPMDLPPGLVGLYCQLDDYSSTLYRWCHQSSEWRSIVSRVTPGDSLLLLPFCCLSARLATLKLKELVEETWPRKLVKIGVIPIDPFDPGIRINRETLIGSYATVLWNCWNGRAHETALNVTACPREIATLSVLVASIDLVPVYCWSEISQELLSLPGWQTISLTNQVNDQEKQLLKDLLEGVRSGIPEDFLLKWDPIIGHDRQTDTALLLKEWLKLSEESEKKNLGFGSPVSP